MSCVRCSSFGESETSDTETETRDDTDGHSHRRGAAHPASG